MQTQLDCRTVGGKKVKTPSGPLYLRGTTEQRSGLPRATAKVVAVVVTLVVAIIIAGLKTFVSHSTDERAQANQRGRIVAILAGNHRIRHAARRQSVMR